VFASCGYNAIRRHGRDLALGARTHAQESVCACVVRGVGGVGTHAAQHWVQRAVACGWQSTNKSRVNRPADHG